MSASKKEPGIKAVGLSKAAYQDYGRLIRADESEPFKAANMGTAKRFNHLCELENLRSDKAKLNLCIFRCSPLREKHLELRLLEKHQHSSQVFMPMARDGKYLAVVCLGSEKPDLTTLKAFIVEGAVGVSYFPGVWHYPMTALENQLDFSCLVYENESPDDCQIEYLEQPVIIEL
ncbi:MAG: ureidoglycolate lyase [Candidatus Obscuribacterales bacterium]|nr:ureidoglycolate lyase [Candidatus Obscuribacterales bacterium]